MKSKEEILKTALKTIEIEEKSIGNLKNFINEEFVRSQAVERLDWRNPIWRNHDGTIAEW